MRSDAKLTPSSNGQTVGRPESKRDSTPAGRGVAGPTLHPSNVAPVDGALSHFMQGTVSRPGIPGASRSTGGHASSASSRGGVARWHTVQRQSATGSSQATDSGRSRTQRVPRSADARPRSEGPGLPPADARRPLHGTGVNLSAQFNAAAAQPEVTAPPTDPDVRLFTEQELTERRQVPGPEPAARALARVLLEEFPVPPPPRPAGEGAARRPQGVPTETPLELVVHAPVPVAQRQDAPPGRRPAPQDTGLGLPPAERVDAVDLPPPPPLLPADPADEVDLLVEDEGDVAVDIEAPVPGVVSPAARWQALCATWQGRPGQLLRDELSGKERIPGDHALIDSLEALFTLAAAAARASPENPSPLPAQQLDLLYRQYKRATTADERKLNPARIVRTLSVWIERRQDLKLLTGAISEALRRDLFRLGTLVEAIYWPGFGAASAAGVRLKRRAANAMGSLLGLSTIVAAGGAAGEAAVRAGGMGRRFTREITVKEKAGALQVVPYTDHLRGVVVHGLEFLPFAATLYYASLEINDADPVQQELARGSFRVWANGTLASLGVSLFSFGVPWMLDKVDMPWVDGADPELLMGTARYLDGPRGTAVVRYIGRDVAGGIAGIVRPQGDDELVSTGTQLRQVLPRSSVWARGVVRFVCVMGLFLARSYLAPRVDRDPDEAWKGQLVADSMLLTWGFWVLLSAYAARQTRGITGERADARRIADERNATLRRYAPPAPAEQVAPPVPGRPALRQVPQADPGDLE
ncbi:hypothetical protein ACT80S_10735 [Ramlibacter sp. MAHUQ-53]|uniref:hypothetical protein n=1 Tax=unclassified Ramlibacter TaxID=2617605 RepID=UPI0036415701